MAPPRILRSARGGSAWPWRSRQLGRGSNRNDASIETNRGGGVVVDGLRLVGGGAGAGVGTRSASWFTRNDRVALDRWLQAGTCDLLPRGSRRQSRPARHHLFQVGRRCRRSLDLAGVHQLQRRLRVHHAARHHRHARDRCGQSDPGPARQRGGHGLPGDHERHRRARRVYWPLLRQRLQPGRPGRDQSHRGRCARGDLSPVVRLSGCPVVRKRGPGLPDDRQSRDLATLPGRPDDRTTGQPEEKYRIAGRCPIRRRNDFSSCCSTPSSS